LKTIVEVPTLAEQLRTERYWGKDGAVKDNKFTCEDFALRLLVQYAASKGLPVKLTDGVRTYRNMELYGEPEHSKFESSLYGFANMVALTYGAPDMQRSGMNTQLLSSPSAVKPGDILAEVYDWEAAGLAAVALSKKNRAHHIQVVVATSPGRIAIYQGNSTADIHFGLRQVRKIFGSNPADPMNSGYGGVPVERGEYRLTRNDSWSYRNFDTKSHYEDELKKFQPFRWNFMEFNR
jgi:hypothetical protein